MKDYKIINRPVCKDNQALHVEQGNVLSCSAFDQTDNQEEPGVIHLLLFAFSVWWSHQRFVENEELWKHKFTLWSTKFIMKRFSPEPFLLFVFFCCSFLPPRLFLLLFVFPDSFFPSICTWLGGLGTSAARGTAFEKRGKEEAQKSVKQLSM